MPERSAQTDNPELQEHREAAGPRHGRLESGGFHLRRAEASPAGYGDPRLEARREVGYDWERYHLRAALNVWYDTRDPAALDRRRRVRALFLAELFGSPAVGRSGAYSARRIPIEQSAVRVGC